MLLDPGIHALSMQDVYDLAVAPFANDRRELLYHQFSSWQNEIRKAGVGATLWIDGSFLTEKPEPSDIDCVIWSPRWLNGTPGSAAQQYAFLQLTNHAHAKSVYNLDLYLEHEADLHKQAYWSGILGFAHDRKTAKGFAEIAL